MSTNTPTADNDTARDAQITTEDGDLTQFQIDLLVGSSRLDTTIGQRIMECLEQAGYEGLHHGRLYPNLDTLKGKGLIEKEAWDRRTNTYDITDRGEDVLDARRAWLRSALDGEDVPETFQIDDEYTKFAIDCLVAIARLGEPKGAAVNVEIERAVGIDVNHGRLYPNLDRLVEGGLVEKGTKDRRTNEYRATQEGVEYLADRLAWLGGEE